MFALTVGRRGHLPLILSQTHRNQEHHPVVFRSLLVPGAVSSAPTEKRESFIGPNLHTKYNIWTDFV